MDEESIVATNLPVSIEERLAQLEQEKAELNDRFLRTAAELENVRRRSRKEVDEAAVKARETVLREVLPVADNLERALKATSDGTGVSGPILDGINLVLRQLGVTLERFDVRPFIALGESFDPNRHEAVAKVEADGRPAGTVVAELQRVYTIGQRLLRPALVTVAKAAVPEGS